jgi:hypothetical protein
MLNLTALKRILKPQLLGCKAAGGKVLLNSTASGLEMEKNSPRMRNLAKPEGQVLAGIC